jgi:hypothetical protein
MRFIILPDPDNGNVQGAGNERESSADTVIGEFAGD